MSRRSLSRRVTLKRFLIILLWYLDSHAFLHSVLIDYLRNVPFAREKLVATLARPFEAPSSAQVKTQKKKVTQQSIPFLVAIPPIASCNQPMCKNSMPIRTPCRMQETNKKNKDVIAQSNQAAEP